MGAEELRIAISDRGYGFDVEEVRERLRERRATGQRHRGWGLQLMLELVDDVNIQSDSNCTTITLVKHR
ncbi:MAG: ATP-binding protein [Candidatus Latescibacterota bacterium]|nr:ATP-binding protein [Candidatus Latescibacterota bacterium]